MKIGIIGVGQVGGTLRYGFNRLGHSLICYDINLPYTSIVDLKNTDVAFICLPTPNNPDGSCDTSLVETAVEQLAQFYRGLAVIKSTVTPGTTERLIEKYDIHLAFCPEFLREKSSYSDFVENHEVCIVGTDSDAKFDLIKAIHDPLPKSYIKLSPTEAELAKYFCNTFNAARIIFASQFFEVCEALGANYTAIKNAVSRRASVGGHYLDCNDNFRAFGGDCLPKDLAAMVALIKEQQIDAKLFEWLLHENERLHAKTA